MMGSLVSAFFIFLVFFGLAFLVDQLLKQVSEHFVDAKSSEIFTIISNSQKAVLMFIGIVLVLDKLGFDVSALVAGLGLTGFAVGLALKDAISNLVAGILTVLYKTIKLEDRIEISGTKGTVVDINLRYVTIKSQENIHLIPNALFLNNKVSILAKDE